jgi:hypothetical protein
MACHAVVALTAAPSPEHGNGIAFPDRFDAAADCRDHAGILVAEDQRHARQNLELAVNHVDIAVAEPRSLDAHENLAWARRGRRHIFENQLMPVVV